MEHATPRLTRTNKHQLSSSRLCMANLKQVSVHVFMFKDCPSLTNTALTYCPELQCLSEFVALKTAQISLCIQHYRAFRVTITTTNIYHTRDCIM